MLAAGLLAFRARQCLLRGLVPWIPVAVWLVVLTLLAWDGSPRLYSGLLHLALGMAAFAIGATGGRLDRVATLVPWVFAAVAWIQLAAIMVALVGLPLRTISGSPADEVNGRAIGLTTHPGEISKLLFFCAMCALLLPQRTTRERWAAWLTLAATLVGVSLTQSRAPLIGLVALIATFMALEFATGRWQRRHIAVVGMTVVLALASIPWMIRRFAVDPGLETRRHAMAVALDVIADHPVTGVGVNGYVAVAGVWDRLTAEGVPVHNIFLLSAAELGILGALLLWLPFALVAVRAARTLRRTRGSDTAARILVSALPGVGLIALTGWGLLQGPYFLLFGFVFGYFGARADPRAADRDPDGGG
jgi:hypothetical protein